MVNKTKKSNYVTAELFHLNKTRNQQYTYMLLTSVRFRIYFIDNIYSNVQVVFLIIYMFCQKNLHFLEKYMNIGQNL